MISPEKIKLIFGKLRDEIKDVGDYYEENGYLKIIAHHKLSEISKWLVLFHEFVEWFLLAHHNISWKDVDRKDSGENLDFLTKAAIDKAHKIALKIERILAKELNIDWQKHTQDINRVYKKVKKKS